MPNHKNSTRPGLTDPPVIPRQDQQMPATPIHIVPNPGQLGLTQSMLLTPHPVDQPSGTTSQSYIVLPPGYSTHLDSSLIVGPAYGGLQIPVPARSYQNSGAPSSAQTYYTSEVTLPGGDFTKGTQVILRPANRISLPIEPQSFLPTSLSGLPKNNGKGKDSYSTPSPIDPSPFRKHRPRSPVPSYVIAGDTDVGIGVCGWLLTAFSWLIVIVTLPFSLCVCFKVVQEYERAVIFRLGRLLEGGSKGPGIFFVLPCIESYQKVDLRTITLDVPPQEVLTRDSVTVSVDAVVYYRVSNATVSVANVENAHHSTRLLAQTTLRNILGTKNLHEILSDRESISASMQTALDEATEPWGIKVERVEIKDVRLPVQLQRAMAAEAEAAREARAKVIAAEGEQKASHALREAADIISQSPSAIQLRYLQTLSSISAEKNSTIIFPIPLDLIGTLLGPGKCSNKSH